MEKIIYNTKLKKMVIVMLLVVLLANFVIPNKSFATSLKDWVMETISNKIADSTYDVVEASWNNVFNENEPWNMGAWVDLGQVKPYGVLFPRGIPETEEKKVNTLASHFVRTMGEVFEKGLTEERAKTLISEHKDDLIIYLLINHKGMSQSGNLYDQYTFYLFYLELTEEEETEFGITQEELKEKVDPEPWEDDGEKDSATLGGILLSPVFYLINFFADAIMSNVGNIMMGNGLSLISGSKLLIDDKIVPNDTMKTATYQVNNKSFLPNFGDAILGKEVHYQYPNIEYTPEKIFSGEIPLLSIDFISGKIAQRDANGQLVKDSNGNVQYVENSNDGWMNIRSVISQWYQILRMIAIIGLLSVLIYTGIKIILSSTAKDKAKYKEWIGNWFMAVGILFFMHFIMAFIISVTGEFSLLIGDSCQQIAVEVTDDGGGASDTFVTNLTGLVRFMIQSENFYIKVGYEVMYIALIFYTIKFTVVYLKRVLNMAFLTLIAPIVALTYPIDKINDGRAQGFEMWLKEYMFNALLQPMHQIMYYILLGTAIGVAASNPIYGIVVLAFMTQAEKLLKSIFGFSKANAGTVGGMAGAFAAGAIASNIKNIARMAGGAGGKGGKGGKDGGDSDGNGIYENPKPPSGFDEGDDELFIGDSNNQEENEPDVELDEDEVLRNTVFGDFEEDNSPPPKINKNPEIYEDDMFKNTVVGSEGFDHKLVHPTTSQRIREMAKEKWEKAKNSKQAKGMANVGKRMLKPVWDLDHKGKEGFKYNAGRLTRKVGRAALGTAIGIGAAAVQAGISITDGNYNPAEGIATFAAGYAGAGQIFKGAERVGDIYREGRDEGDREAIMKGAIERLPYRDDVKKHNKKYKPEERDAVMNIRKELMKQGVSDLGEQDNCIKFMQKSGDITAENIDADIRRARVGHDVSKQLEKYHINPHKSDDVDKFVETQMKNVPEEDRARKETILRNKIECARQYEDAIYK